MAGEPDILNAGQRSFMKKWSQLDKVAWQMKEQWTNKINDDLKKSQ